MARLESGADFGPYRIEGFIAGGGMGEVYGAVHSVFEQAVAIKVLHARMRMIPGERASTRKVSRWDAPETSEYFICKRTRAARCADSACDGPCLWWSNLVDHNGP